MIEGDWPHRDLALRLVAIMIATHQLTGKGVSLRWLAGVLDQFQHTALDCGTRGTSGTPYDLVDYVSTHYGWVETDPDFLICVTEEAWPLADPETVDLARRALTAEHRWTLLRGVELNGPLVPDA